MFSSRLIVVPLKSDAVTHLEWNSDTQELFTTYVNGDKVYSAEGVTFEDFKGLCELASERGSWGSALHSWKAGRKEAMEAADRQSFQELVTTMHPASKARLLQFLQGEIKQDNLRQVALGVYVEPL